jgi:iron complex outermembrane recepter protein
VPAWSTVDASTGYTVGEEAGTGLLTGLRLALSAQNLTDKEPPIVLTGANAIDALTHNPYGRILGLEISKKF